MKSLRKPGEKFQHINRYRRQLLSDVVKHALIVYKLTYSMVVYRSM